MTRELAIRPEIKFNQEIDIINKLNRKEHKALITINDRYGGLCELVCNRILIDGFLGRNNSRDSIRMRVTVKRMNEDKILNSHILDIHNIFSLVIAALFGIYPDNLLSTLEQWGLIQTIGKVKKVNRKIICQRLEEVVVGETLKLEVFDNTLSGHSLLVKKVAHKHFVFFDPNFGAYRNLSSSRICDCMDEQLKMWGANHIYLTKGSRFLERLRRQGLLT